MNIENTDNCEYDCDANECLSTGCERFGKCVFTTDKKRAGTSGRIAQAFAKAEKERIEAQTEQKKGKKEGI
jgi:hypothetical protein